MHRFASRGLTSAVCGITRKPRAPLGITRLVSAVCCIPRSLVHQFASQRLPSAMCCITRKPLALFGITRLAECSVWYQKEASCTIKHYKACRVHLKVFLSETYFFSILTQINAILLLTIEFIFSEYAEIQRNRKASLWQNNCDTYQI